MRGILTMILWGESVVGHENELPIGFRIKGTVRDGDNSGLTFK